jgi:hypothetical protein
MAQYVCSFPSLLKNFSYILIRNALGMNPGHLSYALTSKRNFVLGIGNRFNEKLSVRVVHVPQSVRRVFVAQKRLAALGKLYAGDFSRRSFHPALVDLNYHGGPVGGKGIREHQLGEIPYNNHTTKLS